jgi:molybdopterin-binding protein
MISLHGIRQQLDAFSLGPLNLEIQLGEYFVVLGPTGMGKTSLLEIIAGLRSADGGEVWFNGTNVTGLPPEQRDVGFVYQGYLLFPHLSVRHNIEFGLRQRRMTAAERDRRVRELARILGIEHLLDRGIGLLSGGEQQRVALARALAIQPKLLLLDEPLSALDPKMRSVLQSELRQIHQKLGTTTLHVTHNFEEAISLADRVGIMHHGSIVQVGEPTEVFRNPNSKVVADFVGMENVFKGAVEPTSRRAAGDHDDESCERTAIFRMNGLEMMVITDHVGEVHACVRPEDILISTEEIHSSAQNSFKGQVVRIAGRRMLCRVIVEVNGLSFLVLVTRPSVEKMGLKPGHEVSLTFKASAVHIF